MTTTTTTTDHDRRGSLLRDRKLFQRCVTTYSIILKGRNRHMRCNFLFDHVGHGRADGSAITYLPGFLKAKFGETAFGIKVLDAIYDDDEEMMRDGHIKTDRAYYVVYEDYTPGYSEAISAPPIYLAPATAADHSGGTSTPINRSTLPKYSSPLVQEYLKPAYFDAYIYYPDTALRTKSFYIKLNFGRRARITLSNIEHDVPDALRHELQLRCGHRARGIIGDDGRVIVNDDALWSSAVREGGLYRVSYIGKNVMTGTLKSMPEHPHQQPPDSIPPPDERAPLHGRLWGRIGELADVASDSLYRIGPNNTASGSARPSESPVVAAIGGSSRGK